MGGDDSQKLCPGEEHISSLGHKPPAHCEINNLTQGTLLPSCDSRIPRLGYTHFSQRIQ